jgi:hypothetical protein
VSWISGLGAIGLTRVLTLLRLKAQGTRVAPPVPSVGTRSMEASKEPPLPVSPRQELLLLYLSLPAGGGIKGFTDPIRIMKGLFVYGQETPPSWRKLGASYDFLPYNYGPCSFEIYDDVAALERAGMVETLKLPGHEWKYYGLSSAGRAFVEGVRGDWDSRSLDYLRRIKDAFSRMSFHALLRAVYSKYPEFAKNSLLLS